MTYRTLRQRLLLSAGSTVVMGLMLAAAANSQAAVYGPADHYISGSNSSEEPPTATPTTANAIAPSAFQGNFWEALDLHPQDAWSRLRNTFQWQERDLPPQAQARVDQWIEYYRASPHNIVAITERATPWLAWITQKVSERGLPGEVALIPFVESSFDPSATSRFGAAGLWQFMPGTGDALGLVRNGHYDGRLDVN